MLFGRSFQSYEMEKVGIDKVIPNRLRFHGDIDLAELPAYNYLRSVHNITVERSWLRLRLDFGDNAVIFFNRGIEDGIYNSDDVKH